MVCLAGDGLAFFNLSELAYRNCALMKVNQVSRGLRLGLSLHVTSQTSVGFPITI